MSASFFGLFFFSFSVKHSYCAAPAFSDVWLCISFRVRLPVHVSGVPITALSDLLLLPRKKSKYPYPNPISPSILTPDVCTAAAQDVSCRVSRDCPLFSSAPDRVVRVTAQKLVGGD